MLIIAIISEICHLISDQIKVVTKAYINVVNFYLFL